MGVPMAPYNTTQWLNEDRIAREEERARMMTNDDSSRTQIVFLPFANTDDYCAGDDYDEIQAEFDEMSERVQLEDETRRRDELSTRRHAELIDIIIVRCFLYDNPTFDSSLHRN